MTHTSTEQPWWRKHTDEIERKVASGEMNAATCFTKMLWLVSEASKAQRVPLNAFQRRAIFDDLYPHGATSQMWQTFSAIVTAVERFDITQEKHHGE